MFPMRRHSAALLLAFLLLPATALASYGDRAPLFQSCVVHCERQTCMPPKGPVKLPLALRLTRWTCTDQCRYSCMHAITDQAVSSNSDRVHQYFGKWPFWRLAGMQEPASVLFSLFNLWAHIQGFREARKKIPRTHPMRPYYLAWGLVSMSAWFWSAVFHTRDTPITEKLDYFSAGLAILYSLFYTVVRLFHLYGPSQQRLIISYSSSQKPHPLLLLWGALCVVLYLAHVSYLTLLPRFDYTYNMAANLAVGILHNLLWVSYSIISSPIRPFPLRSLSYRPKHAYKAPLFAVITTAVTSLELFDFPPWLRIVDAHALWHLSTAPIVSFWWSFLIQDALDEGWGAGKNEHTKKLHA